MQLKLQQAHSQSQGTRVFQHRLLYRVSRRLNQRTQYGMVVNMTLPTPGHSKAQITSRGFFQQRSKSSSVSMSYHCYTTMCWIPSKCVHLVISVIHSPFLSLQRHTHLYFYILFVPLLQHTKRKREITAGKVNCLIHFPVTVCISRLPIPCAWKHRVILWGIHSTESTEEVHFFSAA